MKYYCLGIKGAGMSTLANILHDLGNEVVGYDDIEEYKFTEEGLRERNIKIYYDHQHELEKDAIVTYSVALKEDHEELSRARKEGLKIKKYNEILGEITDRFDSICVSGTHGKTTTTSLITHILGGSDKVNYFIGDGRGYANPKNDLFVIESDEFNRHFLAYHPMITVITNIELEHTEIYKDMEDIIQTFQTFANKTENTIIACGDNEYIHKIHFQKKVLFYGTKPGNDIQAKNICLTEKGSEFDLEIKGKFYGHFHLPLYGNHMILNALAAIAVCNMLQIEKNTIEKKLETFKNAKRRFMEEKMNDTIIIDDYAHHPTEIKATLESARQKYPDRKIIAIFKPNTYSRTEKFYREFAESLNLADKTYLTEVDCNRERKEDYPNVSSHIILNLLNNGEMIEEKEMEKLLPYRKSVICMMSCASISHMKEKLIELLK